MRTQSLKVLPLKPGVGQYTAIHATLTARDYFPANFYPSGAPTCIFPKPLFRVFPVLAVVNTGSSVGQQSKKVTLLDAGSRVECSRNINRLQNNYVSLFFFWGCVPKLWIEFELWFEQKRLVV